MSKRSTHLQLAIMGVLPLALGACSDNNPTPPAQPVASSESPVYKTVDDCVNAGNSRDLCQQALDNAASQISQAPRFYDQNSCVNQYGADRCVMRTENGQSIWMPMLTGFMLGRLLSGGSHYVYHPVYVPRPSSTWGSSYNPSSYSTHTPSTTTTRSRSVFGSSASARGSWGGGFGG